MSLVRVFVACALLASVGGQQLSACAGWQTSQQARMECCQRASDCDDPSIADACCAAGETDENAQVSISLTMPAPLPAFSLAVPGPARARQPRAQTAAATIPRTFRNAVLLI